MKQLFESVPVSEKPTEEGYYRTIGKEMVAYFHMHGRGKEVYEKWHGWDAEVTHWLRPIPPPTKEAEQRFTGIDLMETLVCKNCDLSVGDCNCGEWDPHYIQDSDWQEKLDRFDRYIQNEIPKYDVRNAALSIVAMAAVLFKSKGHQEASTGQAGEARTVKSMLENIEIIGELAKEMTEQKLETGTNTPLQIIHNIGMAIEVFVKEVNKSLSSTPSHTVEDDWVRVRSILYFLLQRSVKKQLAMSSGAFYLQGEGADGKALDEDDIIQIYQNHISK